MRTERPLTLTVTEAGNLLGVSRSTAYELVRSGELESVQLRRRVVVPVAVVAERLGISVPDVWLSLGHRAGTAAADINLLDQPVPDVLIEEVPEDVHAELTRRARRRGQSLQQFLHAELERLAWDGPADEALDPIGSYRIGSRLGLAAAAHALRNERA